MSVNVHPRIYRTVSLLVCPVSRFMLGEAMVWQGFSLKAATGRHHKWRMAGVFLVCSNRQCAIENQTCQNAEPIRSDRLMDHVRPAQPYLWRPGSDAPVHRGTWIPHINLVCSSHIAVCLIGVFIINSGVLFIKRTQSQSTLHYFIEIWK